MKILFLQNLIDKLRIKNKNSLKKFLKNNTLTTPKDIAKKKLYIRIVGQNNKIKIGDGLKIGKSLTIKGFIDNSVIEIGENFHCENLYFQLGQDHKNFGKIKNINIKIGDNCSWESGKLVTYNANNYIKIGDKCMFAGNVTLFNTDAHPIFDIKTKKVINKINGIDIGNHVWLGMNSTILKNTQIADNCITGWGSIVTGKHLKQNCVIAGNPAKCVKENIHWDSNGADCGYVDNNMEL